MRTLLTTLMLYFVLNSFGASNTRFKVDTIQPHVIFDIKEVRCISQDKLGFLWIGTNQGLLKFDGNTSTLYNRSNSSISSDTVNIVYEDFEGILWVGTNKGLNAYGSLHDKFTSTYFKNQKVQNIQRHFNTGKLFVVTDKGLFCDTLNRWKIIHKDKNNLENIRIIDNFYNDPYTINFHFNHLVKGRVSNLVINSDALFYGTNQGIFKYDINSSRSYRLYETNSFVYYISAFSENSIIFATEENQLFFINNTNNLSLLPLKYYLGYFNSKIINISESKTGQVNIFTEKGTKYDLDVSIKKSQIDSVCSISSKLNAVLLDKNGIFWYGSKNNGLLKKDPFKINYIVYNEPDSLKCYDPNGNNTATIIHGHPTSNNIWVGTNNGVIKQYKRDSIFSLVDCYKVIDAKITSIYRFNGRIWVGTQNNGLFYSKIRDSIPKKRVLDSLTIYSLIKRTDLASLFVCTNNGVFEFNLFTNEITNHYGSVKGVNQKVYTLLQDNWEKRYVYLGTDGLNYLQKLDLWRKKVIPLSEGLYRPQSALNGIKVNSIAQCNIDREYLWIGTENHGLLRYNKRDNSLIYVDDNKKIDNYIKNINYYAFSDMLWITSKDGLISFDIDKLKFQKKYFFLEENTDAYITVDKTAYTVLFAGIDNLREFDASIVEFKDNYLPIFFSVYVNGILKKSNNKTKWFSFLSVLDKHSSINIGYKDSLSVVFNTIEFTYPDKIRYNYELTDKQGNVLYNTINSDENYFNEELDYGLFKLTVWPINYYGETDINNRTSILIKKRIPRWYYIIFILVLFILFRLWKYIEFLFRRFIIFKRRKKYLSKQSYINNLTFEFSNRLPRLSNIAHEIIEFCVEKLEYDYCAVSFVNHLENNLEIKDYKIIPQYKNKYQWSLKPKQIVELPNLIGKLISKDQTVRNQNKLPHFRGEICKNDIIPCIDLFSTFYPILYSNPDEYSLINSPNKTLIGVVEVGYVIKDKIEYDEIKDVMLSYMISSITQFIIRSVHDRYRDIINKEIQSLKNINEKQKFFDKTLCVALKNITANKGYITFRTFDNDSIIPDKIISSKNISKEQIKKLDKLLYKKIGEISHVTNSQLVDVSHNSSQDYVLYTPIIYSKKNVGAISILFHNYVEVNFFKSSYIKELINEVFPIYVKNQLNTAIRDIVHPFNVFSKKEDIYSLIINNIHSYLFSSYIGIWETIQGEDEIQNVYSSVKLDKIIKEDFIKMDFDSTRLPKSITVFNLKDQKENIQISSKLIDFCQINSFKSIIISPLNINQQTLVGILVIFTKRENLRLFPEEVTFLNSLIDKSNLTINSINVIESYTKISNLLSNHDKHEILYDIVNYAKATLKSDPVIMFRYEEGKKIMIRDAIISEGSNIKKFKESDDGGRNLANLIIESGTRFFDNREEYERYLLEYNYLPSQGYKDFWLRESIKSLAAILIKYNEKPIGVIFYNFKERENISTENQKIIKSFTLLISNAIVNAELLDQVERYRENEITYSKLANENFIASSLLHNTENIVATMQWDYGYFYNLFVYENNYKISKKDVDKMFKMFDNSIESLNKDFISIRNYRKKRRIEIKNKESIRKIIEESLFLVRYKTSNIRITKKLNDSIILCNPNSLKHVFLNLIINSLIAMEMKGSLSLIAKEKVEEKLLIIDVQDSGKGIREEHIPYIFDEFYTTKDEGSGMGLSICKHIMVEHGGDIFVLKNNKKGTCFRLTLPTN